MAEITASMVKDLREKTGAGMMDAKKALIEVGGDMEAAVDWLRKKGLATAAKKSSRTAAEGLVAIAIAGNKAAVVEVNAETDFVARNDQFQSFVTKAAELALEAKSDIAALADTAYEAGKTVQEKLTNLIATIGENMSLRRTKVLEVKNGVVVGYVHNAINPGLGKIGVLVALESAGDKAKLEVLGKQIAMHVAAANPQFLASADVTPEAIEREKNVIRETAKASGKPADIIEKMLEGRMRKFYEEICLLDQVFVMDGETKISKVLENAAKDVGAPVALSAYTRFQLGEGIEKEVADFAAEVAAVVNG
ncbi:MAG: elongation factor Ts [Micavibrio aeruginosavorus]|uniref:Elongation factor Ts n=1 Tax=Micavibrio aeruginosavorus TaxID=349221 RepID=A0A7T5R0L2_9BACT|nr:MAG: elongation factor Ts [Micavibrio aeruginosavorus]